MKKNLIYVDTSVFGGCFDEEFSEDSAAFFEMVRCGIHSILISDVVLEELEEAPARVKDLVMSLPEQSVEYISVSEEIIRLRDAYLAAGILGPKWIDDMTHVAAATVCRADAIVSWNFRHIVRLDKMKAYNQVNLLNGYGILTIISPKEAVTHGDD
ncbi:MAG: hypothetical protein JJE30_10895 [Desulfuromonadales bacterium]|nr:hypothetical protein [Desulfuromonadales bacterium]